jgi:hypothetical protein
LRKTTSRSEAFRPVRAAGAVVLLALPCPSFPGSGEQPPERVRPLDPADGAVVGPRPVFRIAYEGPDLAHPRDLRFRLRLVPVEESGRSYEFDQRQRRKDWLASEPGVVIYRPRSPLQDGTYRWEVAAWSGVEWIRGERSFSLRVDTAPPAAVEGLIVEIDRARGEVVLSWDPVTRDRNDGPEFVARYHVFRHPAGAGTRNAPPREIGVVTDPQLVDTGPLPGDPALLLYQVVAEDEAGNLGDGETARPPR